MKLIRWTFQLLLLNISCWNSSGFVAKTFPMCGNSRGFGFTGGVLLVCVKKTSSAVTMQKEKWDKHDAKGRVAHTETRTLTFRPACPQRSDQWPFALKSSFKKMNNCTCVNRQSALIVWNVNNDESLKWIRIKSKCSYSQWCTESNTLDYKMQSNKEPAALHTETEPQSIRFD